MSTADHWNGRYRDIGAQGVSWYEETPATSIELIRLLDTSAHASVLDVGGGASRLCEALVAAGHRDIGVLDLSRVALDAAQARVGDVGGVSWIEADVLSWEPARTWDVWHDRAVLHFLMTDAERDAYRNRLMSALAPEGAL